MRPFLALTLVLITACHRPSMSGGLHSLSANAQKLGHGVVSMVVKVDAHIDPSVRVEISNQLTAQAKAMAVAQVGNVVAAHPIVLHRTIAPEPAPAARVESPSVVASAPAPAPAIQVNRVNAVKPTVFVLRYQTADGWKCENFSDLATCDASCTHLGQAGETRACSCTEMDGGC